jgi:hypothetical protein
LPTPAATKPNEIPEKPKLHELKPHLAHKIMSYRYKFEEDEDDVQDNREPQKFKGYLDPTYAASSDSKTASGACYAIMIYDAKNNVFKLVPIEKHFRFEKCKSFLIN